MILSFRRTNAVIYKAFKDMFKNQALLIIVFMFPILALLFKMSFPYDEAIEPITSFCTMNIAMIPILGMSSIIAEEKEKGTLRVLITSNVKPLEYLFGISICIFITVIISSSLFLVIIPYEIYDVFKYLLYSSLGTICSILVGATIGLITANQVKVGAISAPIAMIIGMLPVFAGTNEFVKSISKFLYSNILSKLIIDNNIKIEPRDILTMSINIIIIFIIFYVIYKKKKLD